MKHYSYIANGQMLCSYLNTECMIPIPPRQIYSYTY